MKQTSGNKRKALAKNKGKGSESLGIRSSKSPKNSKSQKRLSHYTEGKSNLLLSTRGLGVIINLRMERILIGLTPLPRSGWAIWYKN